MTRKEENKILDAKIESNVNQYKVDSLNAEISAFSSGDLNKHEFLTRKDLKYKPNALDKARFEFSPLGKTFSTGLDKTAQGYQEEGIMKILKDIRDALAGGIVPRGPRGPDLDRSDDDDDDDNDDDDMPDLETEEEASKRIAKTGALNKFKDKIDNFDEMFRNKEDKFNKTFKDKENRLNELNNNVKKIKNYIEKNNKKIFVIENKLAHTENERDNLLLNINQLYNELKETKNELNKSGNDELKEKVDYQENEIKKLEIELNEKDKNINILKKLISLHKEKKRTQNILVQHLD